jgi:hypothetical protein
MYETLLAKIGTTLDSVELIKEHFNYPKTKLTKYPSVFYFPAGFDNEYSTGTENFKVYKFALFVIVGVSQTTMESASTTLAKAVQELVAQFDADWNMGTINGHRAWVVVDSSDPWTLSEEQDGMTLYAKLNVTIRLLSTN